MDATERLLEEERAQRVAGWITCHRRGVYARDARLPAPPASPYPRGVSRPLRLLVVAACACCVAGCFVDRSGIGGLDGSTSRDARVPVPDGCVAVAESCNGGDDDCDGRLDEDFDLSSDPAHCGACDAACPASVPNGSVACLGGACAVTCAPGFDDCDGAPDNGCEARLTTAAHCGACGNACGGATPVCGGNPPSCQAACPAGTELCDGSCADTDTDSAHCGGCGVECAAGPNQIANCSDGVCATECVDGFGDCDGSAGDGCETALTSPSACGSCTNACSAGPNQVPTCDGGACGAECVAGFADCNGLASDGCEADLDSSQLHCGRCGRICGLTESCVAGACATCAAGCSGSCTSGCCTEQCFGVGMPCTYTSPGTCRHVYDCGGSARSCNVTCTAGASCAQNCNGSSGGCHLVCDGSDPCSLSCEGSSGGCELDCRGGAECILSCAGSASCDIDECTGGSGPHAGERSCGSGIRVCNRPCP